MITVPRWAAAPVVRAWVASKSSEVERLPRPRDIPTSAEAEFDGPRVLLFGGGPAVGWGVLSHELALPGALSRALCRRMGRPTSVDVVAAPYLKARDASRMLESISLEQYDALILTLGVNDAGALTSLSRWGRDMATTLETARRVGSPNVHLFVAGLHPIRSIPLFDSALGSLADAHARKMNIITADLCDRLPGVTFAPLTAPSPSGALRFRDARSYHHWADELAGPMARQLKADRIHRERRQKKHSSTGVL